MQKEHLIVYLEKERFAGWPANYGMWRWGDELVVSFTQCYHQAHAGFHARTEEMPAYPLQARSMDGGRTWKTIRTPAPSPGDRGFSADEHMVPDLWVAKAIELKLEPLPRPCPGGINFTHPDFSVNVRPYWPGHWHNCLVLHFIRPGAYLARSLQPAHVWTARHRSADRLSGQWTFRLYALFDRLAG